MAETVLLIGCGDLATALGQQLLIDGRSVIGVRRQAALLPESFQPLSIDVTDAVACHQLGGRVYNSVVITVTPSSFSDEGYERAYIHSLKNILLVLQQQDSSPHIYFVSSTSVYHQTAGEWVDESSDTQPERFSGQRILQAEQLLKQSGFPHTIIRFAGIYGQGRYRLLERIKESEGVAVTPVWWTNRIHKDDCVGFLYHLLQRQFAGKSLEQVYIGCDDRPAPMSEVRQWLAEKLDVKLTVEAKPAAKVGSKRCRNTLLKSSGYRLKYTDYKAGYTELLKQPDK